MRGFPFAAEADMAGIGDIKNLPEHEWSLRKVEWIEM